MLRTIVIASFIFITHSDLNSLQLNKLRNVGKAVQEI